MFKKIGFMQPSDPYAMKNSENPEFDLLWFVYVNECFKLGIIPLHQSYEKTQPSVEEKRKFRKLWRMTAKAQKLSEKAFPPTALGISRRKHIVAKWIMQTKAWPEFKKMYESLLQDNEENDK